MVLLLTIMNFAILAIIVYSLDKRISILEGKMEILESERKAENHPYCKRVNEFYKKLQMREVDDGEV